MTTELIQAEAEIQTRKHIDDVRNNLFIIINHLIDRAMNHDKSKLEPPEIEAFADATHQLKNCVYDSPEYRKFLEQLGPALKHHYTNNSHHPEYYPNGINGMNLLDIIEMFCDWISATKRHTHGNIRESITKNKVRFHISDQLEQVLINTITVFEK